MPQLTEQQKQYMKEYREKNKEKLKERKKEYDEKNKEKKKQYYCSGTGYRKLTIRRWKRQGVKCDDFDTLFEKYINTHNCEKCGCEITSGSGLKGKKKLDHNHFTGEFRNIVCGICNFNVIKVEDKAAGLCKIKVSAEVKKQIEAIAKTCQKK